MLATALALSLSIATIPQGRMWAVDASGNGDYTTIQGAVDNANNGDTVHVTADNYVRAESDFQMKGYIGSYNNFGKFKHFRKPYVFYAEPS